MKNVILSEAKDLSGRDPSPSSRLRMTRSSALIMVDIQNDFIPGGALAVAEGDRVVPIANQLQEQFDIIVATQDWHPANHGSFASQHPGKKVGDIIDLNGLPQVLWPDHCVQHSKGAEFHPQLDVSRAKVFRKGADREIDSYSGFFDNGHRRGTGLGDYFKSVGASDLYICGLATDYCVKFTALDARQLGFRTTLIVDGCRGVNLEPGDVDAAIREMREAGVNVVTSVDVATALQSAHA